MKHILTFDEFLNEKASSKLEKELEKETNKIYDILLDYFNGDSKRFDVSYITRIENWATKRIEIKLYKTDKSTFSDILNLIKSKSYKIDSSDSSRLEDADKFSTLEINIDL